LSSTSIVVARSSLRAIAFVCARCASLRLTSIAPTLAVAASIAIVVAAAIHTESKTIQIFTDIQISAYISHDDTQASPHRSPSPHTQASPHRSPSPHTQAPPHRYLPPKRNYYFTNPD
jgi:hypothetical protein